jgi:UDP-glucose 4-epimerase
LRLGVMKEAMGEAFNLASETETRVIDLAKWINELVGSKTGIVYGQRRNWDKVVRRRASIEKAQNILGYKPKMSIEAGLKKTYEWILENKQKIQECAEL